MRLILSVDCRPINAAIGPMQRSDTIIPILYVRSCVQCSSSSNHHPDARESLCLFRGFPILSTAVLLLVVLLELALAMGQLLLYLWMKQNVMVLHQE